MPSYTPQVISEVERHYKVGRRYATAYLDYWTRPERGRYAGRSFQSLDAILALPPPDSMWFDYALSTNQRGRAICELIRRLPMTPRHVRRFLDVGCGFGGLLAAFNSAGADVRGLEIDPVRVDLARANCQDHGLTGTVVQSRDILEDGLAGDLGRFDVITMIDVIEHVADMPRALANAVDLLEPDGVLVLEIPNRHSLRFVAADGHFSLFGITLLAREDAMRYHRVMLGGAYDVGDYYALDVYRDHLTRLGCEVSQVDSPVHPPGGSPQFAPHLAGIRAGHAAYRTSVAPRLPDTLQAAVEVAFSTFTGRLLGDAASLATGDEAKAFANEYLIDFWTIAAKRVR